MIPVFAVLMRSFVGQYSKIYYMTKNENVTSILNLEWKYLCTYNQQFREFLI